MKRHDNLTVGRVLAESGFAGAIEAGERLQRIQERGAQRLQVLVATLFELRDYVEELNARGQAVPARVIESLRDGEMALGRLEELSRWGEEAARGKERNAA